MNLISTKQALILTLRFLNERGGERKNERRMERERERKRYVALM